MLHRNTYINGPAHLDRFFRWRKDPRVFFAGQLTGVEGYLESAATGLMVGRDARAARRGTRARAAPVFDGARLPRRATSRRRARRLHPQNVTFGLIEDAELPPSRTGRNGGPEISAALFWRSRAGGKPLFPACRHGSARWAPNQKRRKTREEEHLGRPVLVAPSRSPPSPSPRLSPPPKRSENSPDATARSATGTTGRARPRKARRRAPATSRTPAGRTRSTTRGSRPRSRRGTTRCRPSRRSSRPTRSRPSSPRCARSRRSKARAAASPTSSPRSTATSRTSAASRGTRGRLRDDLGRFAAFLSTGFCNGPPRSRPRTSTRSPSGRTSRTCGRRASRKPRSAGTSRRSGRSSRSSSARAASRRTPRKRSRRRAGTTRSRAPSPSRRPGRSSR